MYSVENKTKGNKVLNISVTEEFYDKLYNEAAKRNIAIEAFVRMVCSEWIESSEKQKPVKIESVRDKTIDEIFNELEKD